MFLRFTSLILFALTVLLVSCGAKPDYVGTWRGQVLVVYVDYTFTKNTYECRTSSLNNILIGGYKGTIDARDGKMSVLEQKKYIFNSETNTGSWVDSDSAYTMKYTIRDKQMVLQPSTSTESFTLEKE